MRQKIVAGNWKMNKNLEEAKQLIKGIKKEVKNSETEARVIIAPSFVNLNTAIKRTRKSKIEVAAQNMHQANSGAFTGEVSANMLTNLGVNIVILGHSERREYFNETNDLLAKKVDAALDIAGTSDIRKFSRLFILATVDPPSTFIILSFFKPAVPLVNPLPNISAKSVNILA